MTTTVTEAQQPDYRNFYEKLQLTPEETSALQECMRNSSVFVPSIVTAAIGYGIFRVTPFRAQAKYAALIGGTLGMISSRIFITQTCFSKVASMPNSNLRERMIQAGYYRNNKPMSEKYRFQPMDVQSEFRSSEEPSTNVVFDDYSPMNTHDTYFNDSSDFHLSEDMDLSEPLNVQKNSSYDELRHKNREEFYKKNRQWYTPVAPERPTTAKDTTRQIPTTSSTSSMQEKNKYGDVWG